MIAKRETLELIVAERDILKARADLLPKGSIQRYQAEDIVKQHDAKVEQFSRMVAESEAR